MAEWSRVWYARLTLNICCRMFVCLLSRDHTACVAFFIGRVMFRRLFPRSVRLVCAPRRLFASHPSHERIVGVQLHDKELAVQWSGNKTAHLPYLYLRDNCKERSFEITSKQRLFNPAFALDFNIQAKQAETSEDGQQLCITWPDGEQSHFSSSWLKEHSEGVTTITGRLNEQKLWKGGYFNSMPRFDFEDLMQDNKSLLNFLFVLDSHGLVLVENVGTVLSQVLGLSERISYAKPNCYG